MSLNLDKSTWKRVRLGDVIRRSRTQVDPVGSGVERYVAGGHIDSEGVTIERWGQVGDGQMGSTFRYVFKPGQVLFVSARPYLRKVGVPDFSGVVADKTYVLDAVSENGLLQEFLPFVLSSESFVEYATAEATGSMNPRLLWGPMQRYEFDLPPLDEQKRLVDTLWKVEHHRRAVSEVRLSLAVLRTQVFRSWLAEIDDWAELGEQFEVQLGKMLSSRARPTADKPGYPYLANINIRWGGFDLSNLRRVALDDHEREKFLVRDGDILVCEGGEIGRAAIWDSRIEEVYYQKALHRLRPKSGSALPGQLLIAFLRFIADEGHLAAHSAGSTFAHLTRERLVRVRIPSVSGALAARVLNAMSSVDRALQAGQDEYARLVGLGKALMLDVFEGGA
ncbi:restriction endonuclease subunit S [Micromonospora arborensis]|uniref:restriction endonuclease subunit S n=1 Tax=Micromonospora arborensis TaxID=2116518 RepID=UPI00340A5086